MIKNLTYCFAIVMLLASCSDEKISFSHEVRPVLNNRCVGCHGGVKKHGGLSLLSEVEAFAPSLKTGMSPIVRGSAKHSDLFKRIISDDPDYNMPRDHEKLPQYEVDILKKWIDQGADWDNHWAYEPVKKPKIPTTNDKWAKTNIDQYILLKLNALGLEPNHKIEKSNLARRVSFDITGLPPDQELALKFISGKINYDTYVDALISDSSYGEHWATMWLDLARYADSKGYEKDPHRNIWRYRDWVINALNTDMPFDEFTIDQIAGDILDANDTDKLIATAFHRNSMTNTEGGTDDEEFRVAAVVDRLNTTFEIWQGTTMACAQCHDHPYDPISQKEFYSLMSFFNNTTDADLSGEFPLLESFLPKEKEEIEKLVSFIEKLEDRKVDADLSIVEKIKSTIFPRILPQDCDDYYNMLLFPDGIMSNWTNNVNDMEGREFYFMFEDVDFNHLEAIEATYATSGEKALIRMIQDSVYGELLYESGFKKTKSVSGHEWSGKHEWKKMRMNVSTNLTGKHDVIFEILNPSLEVPEGIVLFKEFELKYDNLKSKEETNKYKNKLIALRKKAERTPIIREKSSKLRRPNQVHLRGNQRTRGDTVQAALPKILNPSKDKVTDRLALAQWLVDDSNLLTARVIVNRVWAYIFGNGVISTLEDFGSQGDKPTHPELLDYLAYNFVHVHNWSLKLLIKEILKSKTYRQSSESTKENMKMDPYNRYFTHGPRIRLTAEQIRDQALAISNLLYDSIGGPSVMPYQPEGVWQTVYNNSQWNTSEGQHQYRRGLYTYWKRSSPYPSMEAFDSPTREVCKGDRIKTNTPNQALVLLNDPVFIEVANTLGKQMNATAVSTARKIEFVYEKCLFRKIDDHTKSALVKLYSHAENELVTHDDNTENVLENPAAVVAHAILNLDAFLNKS